MIAGLILDHEAEQLAAERRYQADMVSLSLLNSLFSFPLLLLLLFTESEKKSGS
jgi:hypothetical protein